MKKRRFRRNAVHHIYQRPVNGIVIFHTRRDFLVFLTIFFTVKKKYRVHILSVCPMIDHLHVVLIADNKTELSAFVQEYTSKFVKEYNRSLDRSAGRLFTCRFGCAPKWDDKDARSAIAYSYNNAPERKLCERAMDYQWNLLAYASDSHPFSERIVLSRRTPAMKKAMSLVQSFHESGKALGYAILGTLFKGLTGKEVLQLTDFILSTYCDVDFDKAVSYYGSLKTMLLAIDSNTGSEYDLKEEWEGYTDSVYAKMGNLLRKVTGKTDMKDILKLPEMQRQELYSCLLTQHGFNERQVRKYLQLPDTRAMRKNRK